MKTTTLISTVFVFLLDIIVFSSCNKENDIEPFLTVNTNTITLSTEGTSQLLQISCNVDWTITGKPSWLKLTVESGNGNNGVAIAAEYNTTPETRNCMLTIQTNDGYISKTVNVIQLGAEAVLLVNGLPSTTLNFGANENEIQEIRIESNSTWNVRSDYEWLRVTPGSGSGNSTLQIMVTSENFSDEDRIGTLIINGIGSSTAKIDVVQAAKLAKNVRVEMSNMTIMSDGFACDLQFGPSAKGYREAFFLKSETESMTDRDLYNELMEQSEYAKIVDWTYLPGWVNPGTTIVYCVAAYGNENNEDGTHKYGPMLRKDITTRAETIYDDMYMSLSYTSSQWKVTTSRSGTYGQRCDEYYYYAAEGDYADELAYYANRVTYAFLAHIAIKPKIAADPNNGYKYGPQTMTFSRSEDKFFCATWGIDRDTKEYSAEISWLNKDLSSNANYLMQRPQSDYSLWNKPRHIITKEERQTLREAITIYRVNK